MKVEAAGRRRSRKAWWGVAAAQAGASHAAAVLVAGGRGADGALKGGGAARGATGAAVVVVVVRGAGQAADSHPGAAVLRRGALVNRGAAGAVHQLSQARQDVGVTCAADPDAVASQPLGAKRKAG